MCVRSHSGFSSFPHMYPPFYVLVKVVMVYFAADAVLLSFGGFASAISAFLTVDAVSANVESVWMMMILV
ncbi:hypothetical protein LOK49_LG07G01695 [Camellia lanceoleosa]|uniref:Uncharacterized protein n=1 Tax=Camellia lanceoleosa TaxID=1840588 RepID=A0ACC0H292_9ERIC|nr:hypothetical protein LOK49_LG07G01695 [Camellia lanceoleosa]